MLLLVFHDEEDVGTTGEHANDGEHKAEGVEVGHGSENQLNCTDSQAEDCDFHAPVAAAGAASVFFAHLVLLIVAQFNQKNLLQK